MKKIPLLFFAFILALAGCRPDNNTQPSHCSNNVQDQNETGVDCGGSCSACSSPSDYYFKFTLGGTQYLFDNDLFQLGSTENYEFGGYVPGTDLSQNGGFKLWYSDSARAADILQLAGDTFYFERSGDPFADIRWNTGGFAPYNYADETSNHSYYVAISSVTFLRRETGFWDLDVYAVRGTFRARMLNGSTDDPIGDATNGEFNMQCSAFHFN
ncbi:MAG: hypothetical protein V4615_08980 [Bacteroidota bacterium]